MSPSARREALTASLPEATLPLRLSLLPLEGERSAYLTAHFSVVDARGRAVTDLTRADFQVREDGAPLDDAESALVVRRALEQLNVPTVLLLDLSRSVVNGGGLESMKEAARSVIDALIEEQQLAIATFAGAFRLRAPLTTDREELHRAIDAIEGADGTATNLFGAVVEGLALWQDGLPQPDAGPARPGLAFGMMLVVSDGDDTAGTTTMAQALEARGERRVMFVRVGEGLNLAVARQLASAGVIDARGGFESLDQAIAEAIDRALVLNEATYLAEYCSPRRTGTHRLRFSLPDNDVFVRDNPPAECLPTASLDGCSSEAGVACESQAGAGMCCPRAFPFACIRTGTCSETEVEARQVCGASCIKCGDVNPIFAPEDARFELTFNADGTEDPRCDELFREQAEFEPPSRTVPRADAGSDEGAPADAGSPVAPTAPPAGDSTPDASVPTLTDAG